MSNRILKNNMIYITIFQATISFIISCIKFSRLDRGAINLKKYIAS